MQTDTAIRKWAVAKNQELHRCGDGYMFEVFCLDESFFKSGYLLIANATGLT